jgi:hypothetical protein
MKTAVTLLQSRSMSGGSMKRITVIASGTRSQVQLPVALVRRNKLIPASLTLKKG